MKQVIISNTNFEQSKIYLAENINNLKDNGCFFVIFQNEYNNGILIHDFMELIEYGTTLDYVYINTIIVPSEKPQQTIFNDNVIYVIWFCKNRQLMKFNKDHIREKHIWKDVEWGKRTKNYNPKGKDPGNVWIPTEDDGNAHITNHILLSKDEIIERLKTMTECNDDFVIYDEKRNNSESDKVFIKCDTKTKVPNAKGIIYFNSSENMKQIKDSTVDAVITSPPYWNLKDYYKEGQIGQESYEVYLQRMNNVWQECYKKLKDTGSLWININIRIQNKHVILIPLDFVKQCKKIGFIYRGIVIWHKSSGIPTNDKNLVDHYEFVLIFSKQLEMKFNELAFNSFSDYKNSSINGKAFWNINRKAGSVGKKTIHPAIYPNELVSRIVKSVTDEHDYVMDPFLGSGTTLISSLELNRNSYGFEYNEGFKSLMLERFNKDIPSKINDIAFKE